MQLRVIKAVVTVVGSGWETAPLFVPTSRTGIEGLDAVGDAPFDGRIVTRIEVQAVNFAIVPQ